MICLSYWQLGLGFVVLVVLTLEIGLRVLASVMDEVEAKRNGKR